MYASFNGNPCTTTASCYSPTNTRDEKGITPFCDELSSLVRRISKHNFLIIGGDMNAQLRKEGSKFYLYNSLNRNGKSQADFPLEKRLACMNNKRKIEKEKYGLTPTQVTLKYS